MVGWARAQASAIDANRAPASGTDTRRTEGSGLPESVKWKRVEGEPLDPLALGLQAGDRGDRRKVEKASMQGEQDPQFVARERPARTDPDLTPHQTPGRGDVVGSALAGARWGGGALCTSAS
jgi:hypothetical protein